MSFLETLSKNFPGGPSWASADHIQGVSGLHERRWIMYLQAARLKRSAASHSDSYIILSKYLLVRSIWKQETHWSQLLILPHLPEAGEQNWLHAGGEEIILTPLVKWWKDFFSLHGNSQKGQSAQVPCSHWLSFSSSSDMQKKKCHRMRSSSYWWCFCSCIFYLSSSQCSISSFELA